MSMEKPCLWARFCGWLLKRMGWTSDGGPAPEERCILLGVPHTSIWDFIVSYLFYRQFDGPRARVMIKKEFFFWPLGGIIRKMGGIPTDRSNPTSMIKSVIDEMENGGAFHLAIALEGSRKPVKRWKTGYHLIARETGATVYLGYYDWGRKRISVGEPFEITDDPKADMQRIYDHYRPMGIQGFHKDQFIVP
jgi:1-acyl-sn-glycerol-3-phosphate acyltransferase